MGSPEEWWKTSEAPNQLSGPAPIKPANQWWIQEYVKTPWWKDPEVTGKAVLDNTGTDLNENNGKEPWWDQKPFSVQDEPEPLIFSKGVDNPFSDFVTQAVLPRLKGLNLDGEAEVITTEWFKWREGGVMRSPQQGAEPVKTEKLKFEEIANKGYGWKLHLNFDAEDPVKVQIVGDFLTGMKEQRAIFDFKVGEGGGKESDAPGKEATIYIGHRDKAKAIAPAIEQALDGMLDEPEGDTLTSDITFTKKISGRFDIGSSNDEFSGHGRRPNLRRAVRSWYEAELAEKSEEDFTESLLSKRYGKFYTGSRVVA